MNYLKCAISVRPVDRNLLKKSDNSLARDVHKLNSLMPSINFLCQYFKSLHQFMILILFFYGD